MTEVFSSPSQVDVDESTSINDLLSQRVLTKGAEPLFERQAGLGDHWVPVSAASFLEQIQELARGLVASGLQVGDRVAIMCRTRY